MIKTCRNQKIAVASILTVAAVFVAKQHGFNLVDYLESKNPFATSRSTTEQEATPIIDPNAVSLGCNLVFSTDELNSAHPTLFRLTENGKVIYEEKTPNCESCSLVRSPSRGDFLADINGDDEKDLVIEQTLIKPDGENHYTYTVLSKTASGVRRTTTWSSPEQASFDDTNNDGVAEIECTDAVFRNWYNANNTGPLLHVVCSWRADQYEFSPSAMKRAKPDAAELKKLIAIVNDKISRYETAGKDGKLERHIDIRSNAWTDLVKLIYSGNAASARKVLDAVWHDDELAVFETSPDVVTTKEHFWKDLWTRVDQSHFADDIYSINNIVR